MKNKRILNNVLATVVSFAYASVYWLGDMDQARALTSLETWRPYVYRQLVPVLARALEALGLRIDLVVVLIVTMVGLLFYLSLWNLVFLFGRESERAEMVLLLLFCLGLILFIAYSKPYDLMTGWLFTLALLYTVSGRERDYLIVFALACLNRETAFILIPIYFAHQLVLVTPIFWRTYKMVFYQVLIFVFIQAALRWYFSGNAGDVALIDPLGNLRDFATQPLRTLLHLFVTGVLFWLVVRGWQYKPLFSRIAFVVMAPTLTLMYLIFGKAFEVRVFWEIYPVVIVLALPTILALTDRKNVRIVSIKKIVDQTEGS